MSGIIQFKFRSAISYDSVLFDGHFITVGEVKRLIAEKKGLGRDTSAELVLSDPRNGEEYKDDTTQLPRNTSVLVRRQPPQKPQPITRRAPPAAPAPAPAPEPVAEPQPAGVAVEDEFGADPFSAAQAGLQAQYAEEWKAIDSMVASQEKTWRGDMAKAARGRGRGRMGGRGIPPPTYMCYRCYQTGHYISDCPTNSDPAYDVKRVRQPVGIPGSMLGRNKDGGLLLPGGDVGSLQPNESVFAAEVAGLVVSTAPADDTKALVKSEAGGGSQVVREDADEVPAQPVQPVVTQRNAVKDELRPSPVPSTAVSRPAAVLFAPQQTAAVARTQSQTAAVARTQPQTAAVARTQLQTAAVTRTQSEPVDEFDFHRQVDEASLPPDRLLEDFDDAVPVRSSNAAPLALGMEFDAEPVRKERAKAGQQASAGPSSRPSDVGAVSDSRGTSPAPFELSEHLLFFQDLLPRGNVPLSDLHKAFFSSSPLTPSEFENLQRQCLIRQKQALGKEQLRQGGKGSGVHDSRHSSDHYRTQHKENAPDLSRHASVSSRHLEKRKSDDLRFGRKVPAEEEYHTHKAKRSRAADIGSDEDEGHARPLHRLAKAAPSQREHSNGRLNGGGRGASPEPHHRPSRYREEELEEQNLREHDWPERYPDRPSQQQPHARQGTARRETTQRPAAASRRQQQQQQRMEDEYAAEDYAAEEEEYEEQDRYEEPASGRRSQQAQRPRQTQRSQQAQRVLQQQQQQWEEEEEGDEQLEEQEDEEEQQHQQQPLSPAPASHRRPDTAGLDHPSGRPGGGRQGSSARQQQKAAAAAAVHADEAEEDERDAGPLDSYEEDGAGWGVASREERKAKKEKKHKKHKKSKSNKSSKAEAAAADVSPASWQDDDDLPQSQHRQRQWQGPEEGIQSGGAVQWAVQ